MCQRWARCVCELFAPGLGSGSISAILLSLSSKRRDRRSFSSESKGFSAKLEEWFICYSTTVMATCQQHGNIETCTWQLFYYYIEYPSVPVFFPLIAAKEGFARKYICVDVDVRCPVKETAVIDRVKQDLSATWQNRGLYMLVIRLLH